MEIEFVYGAGAAVLVALLVWAFSRRRSDQWAQEDSHRDYFDDETHSGNSG